MRVGGCDGGRESGVTLAAVPVVSRAADQVAQEAQSKVRLADGLRVSQRLGDSHEVIGEISLG